MRIEARHLTRRGGNLPSDARNARRSWGQREGWLLELRDEDGRLGLGEASPLPGYSTDTLDSAAAALNTWDPANALAGLGQPSPDLDTVEIWLEQALDTLPLGEPAARFAAETALLDLLGQRLELPAYRLLERLSPRPPARPDSQPVALASLLSLDGREDPVQRGREALAAGVKALKVKVGAAGCFDEELVQLRRLRKALGAAAMLRLDANGAWALEGLDDRLRALAEVEPELLEEPVAGENWLQLQSSPVALAMDESLRSLIGFGVEPGSRSSPGSRLPAAPSIATLNVLARRGLLSALVLKPMALGGALPCLRLARWAEGAKLSVMVSHLFDGPVAWAASAHLALALPGRALACGLAPHAGLGAWPQVMQPMLARNEIVPVEDPGLGISIDLGISPGREA